MKTYHINGADIESILQCGLTSKVKTTESHSPFLIKVDIPIKLCGKPLSLMNMVDIFGTNPKEYEPCFYNQDWYVNEPFANNSLETPSSFTIASNIPENQIGFLPDQHTLKALPSAVELTFIFFVFYLKYGIVLWKNEYLWTSDYDMEGDQIYVGRYFDQYGLAANGFSIHRHLSIKKNYGYLKTI